MRYGAWASFLTWVCGEPVLEAEEDGGAKCVGVRGVRLLLVLLFLPHHFVFPLSERLSTQILFQ